jgi:protoporphyrin/coproporphyrin ferrochelatase
MPRFQGQTQYEHGSPQRIGVLLSNLGTPQAPTASALRPYLRQFLWDPRVVEVPRPVWAFVLNAFVLPFRPRKVAHAYGTIWTDGGSPLLVTGRAQRDALAASLGEVLGDGVRVALGMRYGRPSIDAALQELIDANCRRILHLPLYPQYAAATTATNIDALAASFARRRWLPELRTINQYDDDPRYIGALVASIREVWERDGEPERLLMSFHGIPQRYWDQGDPYPCFCMRTGRLVAEGLGLPNERYAITYQSRFGREPWVQPYTDKTLEAWGQEKLASVDVICPGFSADCLETLEEIEVQNREIFEHAGGGRFRYIPALNVREDHLAMLQGLILRHLRGWID